MTESATTAKSYRDFAAGLRLVAKDMAGDENRGLPSFSCRQLRRPSHIA